ncbi:MAG TPA: copper resistance CopC family protein [Rubrobacter sp.]|nr:copper resistance CopC family protein [Rubrobacter sp.]
MVRAGGQALVVFVGLAMLSMVWHASPALAHAELLRVTPAADETLSKQPGEVRLSFDERVRAEFDPVKVTDEEGSRVDKEDARTLSDDPKVVVASLGLLPEGSYTVEWRVTSADGDPISGKYGFAVDASAAVEGEEDGGVGRNEEETGGPGLGVIIGVLLAGGLVAAGFVVLRRR